MADIDVKQVTQDANQGPLSTGSVFAERFEIIGLLGQGGMSTVYKARQIAMDRIIALKVMHESLSSDSKAYQRLRREAQAVGALNHPNIVKVHSFGTNGNRPYLAMDLIEGKSLASMLAEKNTLGAEQLLPIIVPIAKALAHAHSAGVLHRDVKPSNIMICDNPPEDGAGVYLVDFGIAKLLENGPEAQNLTSDLVGTYAYMSPEQIERAELDGRSDMYSLGCVMYCVLTGAPPFDNESLFSTIYSHVNEEPKPLPPSVPAYLAGITMRMLAKKRDDRFANMDEMVAALEKRAIPPAVPKTRRANRKVSKRLVLGALGLSAAASLVLIALLKPDEKPRPTFQIDRSIPGLHTARYKWDAAVLMGPQHGRDSAREAMSQFLKSHGAQKMGLPAARELFDQYKIYFDPPVGDWAPLELVLLDFEWNDSRSSDPAWQVDFIKNRMWPVAKLAKDELRQMLCVEYLIDRNALSGKELKDTLYSMEPFVVRVEAHNEVERAGYCQATSSVIRSMLPIDQKKAFELCGIMLRKASHWYGEDTPEYASALSTKVGMLLYVKQYQQAEELARRVIPILQKGDYVHKDQSTGVYSQLRAIAADQKDLVRAANISKEAAVYWDTVVPKEEYTKLVADTGVRLNLQLATDCMVLGRYVEAEKSCDRAHRYLAKLTPPEQKAYAHIAFVDATSLWMSGERQKALQVLAQARTVEEQYDFGTIFSAMIYHQSANFLTAVGKPEEALENAEKGLALLREAAPKNRAEAALYLPGCEKQVAELKHAIKSMH